MPHSIVIGRTKSGKSTLAKLLAEQWLGMGYRVGVLDPLGDEWPATWATKSPDYFLYLAKRTKNTKLIVDESGVSVGLHNTAMEWCTTTSRHLGHACLFLAQRAVQLPLTLRENCENAFIFRTGPKDAKILADDLGEPSLLENSKIPQGEFKWLRPFTEMRRGRIDFQSQTLRWMDAKKRAA
jgi:hypothetical protein